jgi:hypothetical protein
MALDFQQVRYQINKMGESAPGRLRELFEKKKKAEQLLTSNTLDITALQEKVRSTVAVNKNLRCAFPGSEPLDHQSDSPPLPTSMTILAADGSQINPNRYAAVDYCLVNVGAILMVLGEPAPPVTEIRTKLYFNDQMYTTSGRVTESLVALMRDLGERQFLAELTQDLKPPVITLTDGPLEIWEASESRIGAKDYQEKFDLYLKALRKLQENSVSTAGYIDKPHSDLIVRLLEIANLPLDQISRAGRDYRPFLGVTDVDLLKNLLKPGQRSAIFQIQSRTVKEYDPDLRINFFYVNVGRDKKHPYLVRVELPAWVTADRSMLDDLHAVLLQQCQILGSRTYPYIIHRSHEVAVVTKDEKNQVERLIALEFYKRGLNLSEVSQKQALKDLPGRTSV